MADTSIFVIIVNKLYHKKKLCPIILLKFNKSLKISIYYTILPLGLTIYLWIKSNKNFLLNA